VGAYLAQQRNLRGISLDHLATLTRIPLRSLERLEGGAFDRDPDGFSRGFVRTVAEALGLDPDDSVARLLPEPPNDRAGLHRGWRSRRVQLGALIGVVVAAAAGTWWAVSDEPAAPPAPEPARELVYRRDAVRALAAETRQLRAEETRTSR
jgi:cytoskeletal protein RodZ